MSDAKYVKFETGTETQKFWLHGGRDWNGRGGRAALRRCKNLTEVAFVPSFYRLLRALSPYGKVDPERLALVAGLAAV